MSASTRAAAAEGVGGWGAVVPARGVALGLDDDSPGVGGRQSQRGMLAALFSKRGRE